MNDATVADPATMRKHPTRLMRLAHPIPVRLSPDLLQRLDIWRGDTMSRAAAIRLLLLQALDRSQA